MIKNLILCFLFCICFSCKSTFQPEYKGVSKFEVKEVNIYKVELAVEVEYYNPNPIGGELVSTEIRLFVNDVDLGIVNQVLEASIKPKSLFYVPLSFDFSPKNVLNKNDNLISGILSAITDKSITVRYEGYAEVRFARTKFKIPLTYEEDIPLKKIKNSE